MKEDSSLFATADCRLTYVCLPDCTAHFRALPRGRGPMPRSLLRRAAAQEMAPSPPGGTGGLALSWIASTPTRKAVRQAQRVRP